MAFSSEPPIIVINLEAMISRFLKEEGTFSDMAESIGNTMLPRRANGGSFVLGCPESFLSQASLSKSSAHKNCSAASEISKNGNKAGL